MILMSIKMKDLPNSEKPYEKMEIYGAEKLSNVELLAIIIKTGTKKQSAISVAQEVLSLNSYINKDDMSYIGKLSINELTKINGIGKVKALQILAVWELARRIQKPINIIEHKIKSTEDVAKLFMNEMANQNREIAKLIILNSKNIILKIVDLSIGGTNYAVLEPKIVLEEPVKMQAQKIILVHNHPSGNPTPSEQDFNATDRIYEAASIMGIELLDHVIIGKNNKFDSVMLKKNSKRKGYI